MDINNKLIRFNQNNLPENFVSIAVQIFEKKPVHAAILIRHNTYNYLHHFPGSVPPIVMENFDEDGWYIYKILDSFNTEDESEIGSFLQYCKRVCLKSNITYSYILDGSHYENNGEFNSNVGLPELGTCVGFCINTLTNALIDVEYSLFELNDWDNSGLTASVDEYSLKQVNKKYPDLDWTLYNAFKKRITPLEYLCSSFFDNYPIRKTDIESIKNLVLNDIQIKF